MRKRDIEELQRLLREAMKEMAGAEFTWAKDTLQTVGEFEPTDE